jgi:hypothetical protein
MNYNIPWTAGRIEGYLRDRIHHADDPEVPFTYVEDHVLGLPEVDRTPRWVIIAALGALVGQGSARMRVWKRDQDDIEDVKVRYLEKLPDPSP